MININFNNFGGSAMANGFLGIGGGFGAGSPLSGCGCGPMGNGFNPMIGMGGGNPMGFDPMSSMAMMSQMMMMMVANMMNGLVNGQMPMSMGPGQFGGMGGISAGSPLNNFLGGGKTNGKSPKKRKKAGKKAGGAGESTRMGPGGKVGNINVEKLIRAIPQGYRANARKHWPSIVAEAQKQGIKNKGQLAYILATTVHESGAGKYMEEIASGSAYEGRSDLGNKRSGDGVRFKGRGYVQITGRNNYTNWGKKLGLNLVGNPELAERPAVAAKILVGGMKDGSFTGRGLSDYINGGKTDFVGARAIVNGSDKAGTFAATAKAILGAMG